MSRFKERFSFQSLMPSRMQPQPDSPTSSYPPKRPPPLDLAATKKAYGHPVDVVIDTEPSPGSVSVRPGQIFPNSQSQSWLAPPKTVEVKQYDSVLHDVLLTPTYIAPSPAYTQASQSSTTHLTNTPPSKKRRTLLNRVSRLLPVRIPPLRDTEQGDLHLHALARMREREKEEMQRFRAGAPPSRKPVLEWADTQSVHSVTPQTGYGGDFYKAGEKRDRSKEIEARNKKKQMRWRILIAIVIVALAVLIIVLCTTQLRRPDSASTPAASDAISSSSSASPTAVSQSSGTTPISSAQAPIPTDTSQTLASCLSQFSSSAPTNPLSYPCSDCVPLLQSTSNDYLSPLSNANSTGVGAALQFCTLREVLELTGTKGNGSVESSLRDGGWGRDASPCGGWQGVSCDERGRITTLTLKYPSIPNTLPSTLTNLVSLKSLTLVGSSSIPTGTFPNALLRLPNISVVDIEQTAMTGPLDGDAFAQAKGLISLTLVGNRYLGALPNLGQLGELLTLVVTGQELKESPIQQLTNKLTYLDLSYNSLSGTIPSSAHLTALNTLYLDSNAFTSPPAQSFPSSLQSLSLNNNPSLTGQLPNTLCAAKLASCDLRGTNLGPANIGNASRATSIITLAASGTASATVSTSVATGSAAPSCGVCKFT